MEKLQKDNLKNQRKILVSADIKKACPDKLKQQIVLNTPLNISMRTVKFKNVPKSENMSIVEEDGFKYAIVQRDMTEKQRLQKEKIIDRFNNRVDRHNTMLENREFKKQERRQQKEELKKQNVIPEPVAELVAEPVVEQPKKRGRKPKIQTE